MPRLPGGRHVAVKPMILDALIHSAAKGVFTHKLMAIRTIPDLYAFLEVLYFRRRSDPPRAEDIEAEPGAYPAGLVPWRSGLTVANVLRGDGGWTAEELTAFQAFLREPRMQAHFAAMLAHVEEARQAIRAGAGNDIAQLLALWWDAGVHPLQPGDQEEH